MAGLPGWSRSRLAFLAIGIVLVAAGLVLILT
ncbi:hypothetical protein SAMN05216207_101871 [Pseudonocardia ammonioxydans]|uniref:Uncharacterized protein n=1 Tax=Pseudonocardia ammonioxydans TaxID=260086 RepID=A0A1I5AP19_PSUAM|nr:hypothetical protein SAMN05216207_101871 [Pseudonocardia ammonioxydans]